MKCLFHWADRGKKFMRINLWDGMFEFDFDWKAVVGIGIIILGYAFIKLLAVMP